MLTYSLDEQGDFENTKNEKKPVFIGGVIYDDHDDDRDRETERRRIVAYYKAAINDASDGSGEFRFPKALHSNGNPERDNRVVRPVKKKINSSLREFLMLGTYNGNKLIDHNGNEFADRKGTYHIFVILKSNEGMTKLINEHASIFAKDDYASNLYFHMADEVITRIIFYNPIIGNIKRISLDIATRTTGNLTKADPISAEYEKLGYKKIYIDNNGDVLGDDSDCGEDRIFRYSLTNPDIYRTLIAEEILDANQTDINVEDFKVRSIKYGHYNRELKMEFLYMADTICSNLGYQHKGEDADAWLTRIENKAKALMGHDDSLIFGYDEIENIYAKAWRRYEDGDYYNALMIAYEAGLKQGAFAQLYKKKWFKKLEEKIIKNAKAAEFVEAVRKLNEYMYDNHYDQSKGLYVFSVLEKVLPNVQESFRSPEAIKILYTLYDIGVSVYCHLGDSRHAAEYYKLCKENAKLANLEEFLNTINKMVVFYCDYFDLKKALKIANDNVRYQEKITGLKEEINIEGMSEVGKLSLGKALSQRGQVYAFMRDERAETNFRDALANMEEGSANYKITQSYLLHYYLDKKNITAYTDEAVSYFGGCKTPRDQLKYIIEEGSKKDALINMKYALYVFVRGLYVASVPISDKVWQTLKTIEPKFGKKIGNKEWQLSDHPAELIFKYMAYLAACRDEKDTEEYYVERLKNSLLHPGPTVEAIRDYGVMLLTHTEDVNVVYDFLKENFTALKNLETPENKEEALEKLEEIFTFMYQ